MANKHTNFNWDDSQADGWTRVSMEPYDTEADRIEANARIEMLARQNRIGDLIATRPRQPTYLPPKRLASWRDLTSFYPIRASANGKLHFLRLGSLSVSWSVRRRSELEQFDLDCAWQSLRDALSMAALAAFCLSMSAIVALTLIGAFVAPR